MQKLAARFQKLITLYSSGVYIAMENNCLTLIATAKCNSCNDFTGTVLLLARNLIAMAAILGAYSCGDIDDTGTCNMVILAGILGHLCTCSRSTSL